MHMYTTKTIIYQFTAPEFNTQIQITVRAQGFVTICRVYYPYEPRKNHLRMDSKPKTRQIVTNYCGSVLE